MSSRESSSGSGTHCCLRYVCLCNFQNVLHNFEITRAQFENFWHKFDANPDHNANSEPTPDLNPNPNASQIA